MSFDELFLDLHCKNKMVLSQNEWFQNEQFQNEQFQNEWFFSKSAENNEFVSCVFDCLDHIKVPRWVNNVEVGLTFEFSNVLQNFRIRVLIYSEAVY